MNEMLASLKQKLIELTYLKSTLAILQWDQEVFMPKKGARLRGETMAHLAGLLHERFLALNSDGSLDRLKKGLEASELTGDDAVMIREVVREYERERKLPGDFVHELTKLVSEANTIWIEARSQSNFTQFVPYLEKIVAMKRQEAEYIGYNGSPYDALLDTYEPYMTTDEVAGILGDLKTFLVPFLQAIRQSTVTPDPDRLRGRISRAKQIAINEHVAKQLGYDFDAGRLDVSAHPFTTNFHPEDVRITTRFYEDNLFPSLMATIHEAGHALYEQGLRIENFGTPMGESVSLGIHESQSKIWENMVGRSLAFWQWLTPYLQKQAPKVFRDLTPDDLYQSLNAVAPSFIRVDADEVTYNLHIILRFEIERGLIEKEIEVAELPKIWNRKMKDYFGLDVPDDAQGVLQDVHWSYGSIGYFPTYSLGNLYAAQFYAQAKKDLPNLEEQFKSGHFQAFREWLRQKIHLHGKTYTAQALINEVTGEAPTSRYFTEYLQNKYGQLYHLKQ